MIAITKEEKAIKKMAEINPNFIVLSEFKGWREDIVRKCNVCGDIRTVQARTIIEKDKNGNVRKCPVCAAKERGKKLRKTQEQFIKELQGINDKIEIIGEYITTSDKIKCKCLIDGFIWESTPHSLLEGHGCPECYRKRENRRTDEEFKMELYSKFPDITPIEPYTLAIKNILVHCDICGYEWQVSPNVLLNRKYGGCPKCSNHAPVSEQEMIDRLAKTNPTIKYVGGYKGIIPHANFECLKCGHKWDTPPNSVLHGRGCPNCKTSRGENEIKKVLDNLNISYIQQHKFDDCKDKRSLPFDFYIPLVNLCIEYDGEQHFMPVRFSKEETYEEMYSKFVNIQKHDKIKTFYCSENNIKLIRIPYTEFCNIEEILNKYFLKLKRKKIYGVAGKLGNLDMKGEIHTYQDMNNQSEKIHLMLKDFTYGFMLTNIENFAKITLQ